LVGYFYESGNNPQKLYKTTNGGSTWDSTSSKPPFVQVLKFYDQSLGLAVADVGRIFRTLDGGSTWQAFPTPHQGWGNDIEFAPSDPSFVWMVDNAKICFSQDTGSTWTEQRATKGRDLVFTSATEGWLVGDDGTLMHTTNGGTTALSSSDPYPEYFALEQNYPNPFNSSTIIGYRLLSGGMVRLCVCDLLGREVAVLVNEDKLSGLHTVSWSAAGLASGVYFCTLAVFSFSPSGIIPAYRSSRQMLLMK
jgi:hypothetical protein